MGSSLILRLKGSVVAHSLQRISAGIKGARMMSSGVSDESPSRIISSSPWLTLPPAFEGSDMVFNLYKLAEKKVETIKMGSQELELPDDINDVRIVGSSHGWLALFNRCNNQMFLSNPITHELIKLPPVHTLPDPRFNLRDGHGSVSKMIISCSPHEEECRAMMTFGPADRLAFCWPGSSTEWTPIGDLFLNYEDPQFRYARVYEDLAYCSRSKLFTCITHSNETEDWNLSDPGAPELEWRWYLSLEGRVEDWDDIRDSRSAKTNWDRLAFMFQGYKSPWWKENLELLQLCRQIPYQVFVNESDDMPLIVMRFLFKDTCIPLDNHDSGRKFPAYSHTYPDKTVGFFVYKFEEGFMKLVEDSLDGLAIFVGSNNSFVVSAAEFPGILEPNSIYFTNSDTKKISGIRHDIGIFNYEKKAFSPFLLPYDVPSTASPPIWFTPSRSEF